MAKLGPKIDLDNTERKSRVWFMSDLHYNHQNIIKICGRDFSNVEDMNLWIVDEMCNKIGAGDWLFDLGDLIWKENPVDIKTIGSLLPLHSYRILGNHDSLNTAAWGRTWDGVYDLLDLIIKYKGEDIQMTLSHYPLLDWNKRYHGSWNLHGHCHGNVDRVNQDSGELRLDLGFDGSLAKEVGSFLIPFETIVTKMKEKTGGKTFRDWAYDRLH